MNPNIQNSLLSSVQTSTIELDTMDLHQNSKWTDTEVRKILDYLAVSKNFQKYCREKKTKTYNKLAEILETKNSAQIKNKLSSLESSYRRVKTKYQDFLQNFNPKNSEQIRLCKDNVLKEFPFFFDMDEIFRIKLHNVKLDATPSASSIDKINNYNSHLQSNGKETDNYDIGTNAANNLISSFLDMESIQKILKKNGEENRTDDNTPNTSDSIKDHGSVEDSSTKQLNNVELNNNTVRLNNQINAVKNTKKRHLYETDILELAKNAKELTIAFKEYGEKRLKLQQENEEKKLLLKKYLAEKEWENKLAIEEKKLEIQKQHNLDMRALRERELNLEESKQKIEREKLELEKVQLNLQIKLYEDKLLNNYHNNDLSRGLTISSTLATLNNMNSLNSVQVLQNTNNLKIDNPKK